MMVSGVCHFAEGAIGLEEGVFALDYITIAGLVLGLVVAGVRVLYGV